MIAIDQFSVIQAAIVASAPMIRMNIRMMKTVLRLFRAIALYTRHS